MKLAVIAVQAEKELDRGKPVHIICASGYRSSIASSLLEQKGFARPTNVVGGMTAWLAAQLPTTESEA